MYGLPQAGILANQLLKKRLKVHDYFDVPHTPGLFTHKAHLFHTYSKRFWCQVHRQGTRRSLNDDTQATLQDGRGLERGTVLRHHPQMEL